MQEDHDEISKLLRLKRFEQPPPDYFERFMEEFKERQRSQLLREPAWRIAWDRMWALLGEQIRPRLAYGLAYAAILIAAAIASVNILESRPVGVASAPEQRPAQTASLNLNARQVQLPRSARTAPYGSYGFVFHAALCDGCAACIV